ncbi:hypothetical protein CLO_2198 [Clostridium botulinum E1 str. 'BoNT E Beluga']|nr:hypothetical protein CLO_2198 [Clostridium botulinum E1 str. 'BoNT E Beluga']
MKIDYNNKVNMDIFRYIYNNRYKLLKILLEKLSDKKRG